MIKITRRHEDDGFTVLTEGRKIEVVRDRSVLSSAYNDRVRFHVFFNGTRLNTLERAGDSAECDDDVSTESC